MISLVKKQIWELPCPGVTDLLLKIYSLSGALIEQARRSGRVPSGISISR